MPSPRQTTSLRAALQASRQARGDPLVSAQTLTHGHHYVVSSDGCTWWLTIDGLPFPLDSLEAVERLLTSGKNHIPLRTGWLSKTPRGDLPPRSG